MPDLGISTCLFNLSIPADYVDCLSSASNNLIFDLSFMAIIIIFVGGWSLLRPINEGLMVGGFISTLIGIALWALETISIKSVMFPLFLMLVGIFITIVQNFSKD